MVSALPSNYIVWLEGVFDVPAGVPIPISAHSTSSWHRRSPAAPNALFDHTAQSSVHAEGMSYTSQSGTFPSATCRRARALDRLDARRRADRGIGRARRAGPRRVVRAVQRTDASELRRMAIGIRLRSSSRRQPRPVTGPTERDRRRCRAGRFADADRCAKPARRFDEVLVVGRARRPWRRLKTPRICRSSRHR